MIPKVIHYCWFGKNSMNNESLNCIETWKKYMPSCKIIEWNEDNFDINCNEYVSAAYSRKKWAFVADYVRVWALINYGGIYLDVDMKIIKDFNFALQDEAFCGLANPGIVSMGLIGSKPNHPILVEFFNIYKKIKFINEDGTENHTTNVTMFSNLLKAYGLSNKNEMQCINNIKIYPIDFFYPTNYLGTRKNFTQNTCTVHLHHGSWLSKSQKIKLEYHKVLAKFKLDIILSKLKRKCLLLLKGIR